MPNFIIQSIKSHNFVLNSQFAFAKNDKSLGAKPLQKKKIKKFESLNQRNGESVAVLVFYY